MLFTTVSCDTGEKISSGIVVVINSRLQLELPFQFKLQPPVSQPIAVKNQVRSAKPDGNGRADELVISLQSSMISMYSVVTGCTCHVEHHQVDQER